MNNVTPWFLFLANDLKQQFDWGSCCNKPSWKNSFWTNSLRDLVNAKQESHDSQFQENGGGNRE